MTPAASPRAAAPLPAAPLAIRQVPDPVLRQVAAPVAAFDEALGRLARDMLATMYAAPGRGLAAPQVGVALRLFVMDVGWRDGAPDPLVLVNPVLLWASDARETREEACLSIPGAAVPVSRPAAVRLGWQDLGGARHEATFEGFAATCAQHEMDHLDGVLCTDRAGGGRGEAGGG